MNPENNSEMVVDAEAAQKRGALGDAVETGAIAVSYRSCEFFEGGLGI